MLKYTIAITQNYLKQAFLIHEVLKTFGRFFYLITSLNLCVCAFGLAFKARTRINFLHSKWGTFWQSEVKISVLALWLGALSSLFHNMGVGGYGRYPLFVRARHVQRCVKKCPHFECVIHRFVLALNARTNTLYTRVYIVSSLWMPGQVGVWDRRAGGFLLA